MRGVSEIAWSISCCVRDVGIVCSVVCGELWTFKFEQQLSTQETFSERFGIVQGNVCAKLLFFL